MNKKTLTYALVAASIAVTCAQLVADIRIEAVGVASTHLGRCPDQKTLALGEFHQYKIFGHFSLLTLGNKKPSETPQAPLLTKSQAPGQSEQEASLLLSQNKAWNRLILSTGNGNVPLDVFKSSSRSQSSTGTVLSGSSVFRISDWSTPLRPPVISIQGNTPDPSGLVVLCVDFVPRTPIPVGQIILSRNPPRTGDKIAMAWKIQH